MSEGFVGFIPPVTRTTFPDRSGMSVSGLKLGPPPNILKNWGLNGYKMVYRLLCTLRRGGNSTIHI